MLSKKQKEAVDGMQAALKTAPWILRVTERKGITGPVLEVCERQATEAGGTRLQAHGRIYHGALRTCTRAIQLMLSQELDEMGRPAGVQTLIDDKMDYRGQIPMHDEAGAKLALLSILQAGVKSMDRVELMSWRIDRMTREEALYWLAKVTLPIYGPRSIEWAKSGLRVMLGGMQGDDDAVAELLGKLQK